MSYFFYNEILLPLFDNLPTAPPRVSIKQITVASRNNL